MKPRRLARWTLAVGSLFAAGCYHYVAPTPTPIPRGTPVRVRMASPRSIDLPALTVHDVDVVLAEMVREDDGTLVLSARWLDVATGEGYDGECQTLTIPRSGIARLEVRKLSRWRTAALLAGGFVATYLGFDRFNGSDPGSGTSGGGTHTR